MSAVMNEERLLRLADELDAAQAAMKPSEFDMEVWGIQRPGCGTAVCACGLACRIPEFKEAGLHLELAGPPTDGRHVYWLRYGDRTGFGAAREFFGLHREEDGATPDAYHLFDANEYPEGRITPADVAKRIRGFVAKHRGG